MTWAILAAGALSVAAYALGEKARNDDPPERPGKRVTLAVDPACAGLLGRDWKARTGPADPGDASVPERPSKGAAAKDPFAGTCIARATDHVSEPPTRFVRNDYSRRQAFNSDGSRFMVYASGGAWHLYDARDLGYLRELRGLRSEAEPQWHPQDPRRLYFMQNKGGMQLQELDVESNVSNVVADFRGKLPWKAMVRATTGSEGSPSADGRVWCFMAKDAEGKQLGMFSYDHQAGRVLGTRAFRGEADWISTAPSGRFCVVGADSKDGGTVAWDTAFAHERRLAERSEHSDIAIGNDGRDYYVFIDQKDTGELTMVALDDGQRTRLMSTWIGGSSTSLHVSGKAFDRPGWVLVSTFNYRGKRNWMHEQLLAVELKADPVIIHLASHHARFNGYWTQPQASVDRQFTRALFNSNWGSGSGTDVDAYLVTWPERLLQSTR